MTFRKRGLKIRQEGNVFRIFSGEDIDRQLRIKDMRDDKALAEETDRRSTKAPKKKQEQAG